MNKTEEAPAAPAEKKVAPGIKDFEADEPLLQENPQRFVLFPIKYHEVRPHPISSNPNTTGTASPATNQTRRL